MKYRERNGSVSGGESGQDRLLEFLYGTVFGRRLVRFLIRPSVSRLGGMVLSTRTSCLLIKPFVKKTGIRLEEYEKPKTGAYSSYNEFFCRRIRKERRPVCDEPGILISPCDGKVSVYPIGEDSSFLIKNTRYTVDSLLRSARLARRYQGGWAFVVRLPVDDYHRYGYAEGGVKSRQRKISGVFHTVNPAANDCYPIYKENTREYCLIRTPHAGTIVQMEVGALMVGTIRNYSPAMQAVRRGEEKGRFEFGGSTVVVLTEPGKVMPDADLAANTAEGWETAVKMGEKIGEYRIPPSSNVLHQRYFGSAL